MLFEGISALSSAVSLLIIASVVCTVSGFPFCETDSLFAFVQPTKRIVRQMISERAFIPLWQ